MTWHGGPVDPPSSLELRELVKELAGDEPGFILRCPCGAARYCAGSIPEMVDQGAAFLCLHEPHRREGA